MAANKVGESKVLKNEEMLSLAEIDEGVSHYNVCMIIFLSCF